MTDLSEVGRDVRDRLVPDDLAADLVRFAAALMMLIAAIILALARVV